MDDSDNAIRTLVMSNDAARADRAIALPLKLTAPDGRVFWVQSWRPSVVAGKPITVKAKLDVSMMDDRTEGV